MGEEGRLIEWTDRTIDCTGIDSHEIRDLKIGSFGATVRTQMGPVIIEMHEYAYVHGGKTIHSCGQMEYNKITVNDKSFVVTGETPHIKTVEGYMIPMRIVNGLPYIEMRPYTDEEWKELPHVRLTMPGEWDPSALDSPIPVGWYGKQEQTSEYLQDMPFDQFGHNKMEGDEQDQRIGGDDDSVNDDLGDMPKLQLVDSDDESEADEYEDEVLDDEPTTRRTIEVHLHNLVRNEMINEYHAFEVGDGQWTTIEKPFMTTYEVNVQTRRAKRKTQSSTNSEPKGTNGKRFRRGMTFTKEYPEGIFKGTVTEVPTSKKGRYHVIYEDNEEEDLTQHELERLVRIMNEGHPKPIAKKRKKATKKKVTIEDEVQTKTPEERDESYMEAEKEFDSQYGEVDSRLDYNNKAKSYDGAYRIPIHTKKKTKKWDYKDCMRFFPGASEEVVRKTFQNTTQFGTSSLGSPMFLRNEIKAANPALNIPRRNEPVASDTVFSGTPAIEDGAKAAQYFVGRRSYFQSIRSCGKTGKQFHKVLMDEIRQYGAMDILVTDSAKLEISERVNDILRTMVVKGWQSEPYKKNQNFAERKWRDAKAHTNVLLQTSGATPDLWFLALAYVIFVMNHTALESLNWRTPIEWLLGYTPDITRLLKFEFYEPVYFPADEHSFPKDNTEILGRFVGISETVGHKMTYKILTENKTIVTRSIVRTARDPKTYTNKKAMDMASHLRPKDPVKLVFGKGETEPRASSQVGSVETVEDEEMSEEDKPPTEEGFQVEEMFPDPADEAERRKFVHSLHEDMGREMPTIDVSKLLGRTFINDPDEDGEQF